MQIFLGVSFSTPPIIRGKDPVHEVTLHRELDTGLSGLPCCSIFQDTLDKDLESWHVADGVLPDQLHSLAASRILPCLLFTHFY